MVVWEPEGYPGPVLHMVLVQDLVVVVVRHLDGVLFLYLVLPRVEQ
jgi:hypothetical protein